MPQITHQISIYFSNLATMTQSVVSIDLLSPLVVQEEVYKRTSIRHALQSSVHEASVTQVLQTNKTEHLLPLYLPLMHIHLDVLLMLCICVSR